MEAQRMISPGTHPTLLKILTIMEDEEEFYMEEEAPPEAAEIRLGGDDERMQHWRRPPVDPPISQSTDAIGKFRSKRGHFLSEGNH